jgi:rhodanese-related sulfurtransferase
MNEVAALSREEVLERLTTDRRVVLVEALPVPQFQRAHISGAINIPYDQPELARDHLPDPDADIIVYCARERCERGRELAAHLVELGYSHVFEYPGGKQDWHRSGLPITGDMPPYST